MRCTVRRNGSPKTLSFLVGDRPVLVVMAGDAKVNNSKFKAVFKEKARMLTAEQAEALVGHAVGGVCPFAVNEGVQVYLDDSLKRGLKRFFRLAEAETVPLN